MSREIETCSRLARDSVTGDRGVVVAEMRFSENRDGLGLLGRFKSFIKKNCLAKFVGWRGKTDLT